MRCVIVGAACIADYEKIKTYLKPDDFFIFCDGGLNHVEKLGVCPHLIIGDFDSYKRPAGDLVQGKKIETIQLPHEKDWTDSYFAAMEAVRRGFDDFLLIGLIGQRFDHSLVNISVLLYLFDQKKTALLVDDYSEMQIAGSSPVQVTPDYSYFSLLCVDGPVSGVNITDAKYPLKNGEITTSFQYASSNETLPGKTAVINVQKGRLLLMKIF